MWVLFAEDFRGHFREGAGGVRTAILITACICAVQIWGDQDDNQDELWTMKKKTHVVRKSQVLKPCWLCLRKGNNEASSPRRLQRSKVLAIILKVLATYSRLWAFQQRQTTTTFKISRIGKPQPHTHLHSIPTQHFPGSKYQQWQPHLRNIVQRARTPNLTRTFQIKK